MLGCEPLESEKLAAIGRELACRRYKLAFQDRALEAHYNQQRLARGRRQNTWAMLTTILLFDLFILGELRPCPEVLALSAALRFGIVTPAALIFWFLDSRRHLGRWSETAMATLLYLPTLFGCLETFAVHHVEALTNFQAIPLIQLALLTCRVSVRHALWSVALAGLTYTIVTCSPDYVPGVAVPSLVLTDIAIGVTILVFSCRLDYRERQVFLLELQSGIGRTMLAAQNEELRRLTRIDALTALGNRRCFDEWISFIWSDARMQHTNVTLVMFDVDCFKLFNDTLGHQAGDECLADLARTVAQSLRDDSDKLARYGGEEFAIVLPGAGRDEGRAIAERVRLAVMDRAIPHPGSATGIVTVSLGVATVVPAHHSASEMVELADNCLYEAKRAGRNIVIADKPAVDRADTRRQSQEALLYEV